MWFLKILILLQLGSPRSIVNPTKISWKSEVAWLSPTPNKFSIPPDLKMNGASPPTVRTLYEPYRSAQKSESYRRWWSYSNCYFYIFTRNSFPARQGGNRDFRSGFANSPSRTLSYSSPTTKLGVKRPWELKLDIGGCSLTTNIGRSRDLKFVGQFIQRCFDRTWRFKKNLNQPSKFWQSNTKSTGRRESESVKVTYPSSITEASVITVASRPNSSVITNPQSTLESSACKMVLDFEQI